METPQNPENMEQTPVETPNTAPQSAPVEKAPTATSSDMPLIIGAIVIVLMLVAGGFYLWMDAKEDVATEEPSEDFSEIEKDLEEDLSSIDEDFSEIDAALSGEGEASAE